MVINAYVDDILTKVCKRLGIEIQSYEPLEDPTKTPNNHNQEWTIQAEHVKEVEKQYNAKVKAAAAQRKADKAPFTFFTKKETITANKKRKVTDDNNFKSELKKEFKLEKNLKSIKKNKINTTTVKGDNLSSP